MQQNLSDYVEFVIAQPRRIMLMDCRFTHLPDIVRTVRIAASRTSPPTLYEVCEFNRRRRRQMLHM
ncbi:MAG: hypothetical protein CL569_02220 [Alphaproteobacteria bacterium]|nr:hypothetical protein [Alphaproteobacteria bacterium]